MGILHDKILSTYIYYIIIPKISRHKFKNIEFPVNLLLYCTQIIHFSAGRRFSVASVLL